MSNEAWDFIVVNPVRDPGGGDRPLYNPGEGIMAQVVDDLGLIVGEDVTPARPNSIPMPAGNASRAQWARYAEIQGMAQDKVDGLTRDELRDEYIEPEPAKVRHGKAVKADEPAPEPAEG
jgi:hypothetical protein